MTTHAPRSLPLMCAELEPDMVGSAQLRKCFDSSCRPHHKQCISGVQHRTGFGIFPLPVARAVRSNSDMMVAAYSSFAERYPVESGGRCGFHHRIAGIDLDVVSGSPAHEMGDASTHVAFRGENPMYTDLLEDDGVLFVVSFRPHNRKLAAAIKAMR